MILHDMNSDSAIIMGSIVFYGFRFNITNTPDFDYDNYLANKEDAEKLLNCRVVPVDMLTGEYAIVLIDCFSCQFQTAPKFHISKKFKTRKVTDEDKSHLIQFAEFFKIPPSRPAWRHAISNIMVTASDVNAAYQEPESVDMPEIEEDVE